MNGGVVPIEIIQRALNEGALAGFESSVTRYGAELVGRALADWHEQAIAVAYREGFEAGEFNQRLLNYAFVHPEQP